MASRNDVVRKYSVQFRSRCIYSKAQEPSRRMVEQEKWFQSSVLRDHIKSVPTRSATLTHCVISSHRNSSHLAAWGPIGCHRINNQHIFRLTQAVLGMLKKLPLFQTPYHPEKLNKKPPSSSLYSQLFPSVRWCSRTEILQPKGYDLILSSSYAWIHWLQMMPPQCSWETLSQSPRSSLCKGCDESWVLMGNPTFQNVSYLNTGGLMDTFEANYHQPHGLSLQLCPPSCPFFPGALSGELCDEEKRSWDTASLSTKTQYTSALFGGISSSRGCKGWKHVHSDELEGLANASMMYLNVSSVQATILPLSLWCGLSSSLPKPWRNNLL